MKCPVCGTAEMTRDTRDMAHVYKGQTVVIPAVKGDYCPVCNECLTESHETDRIIQAMNEFSREVNASVVDPSFISQVRKKLALDQREAGEIFGGGVNAFSRYETGKTQPSVALVKLLKLLDRHPDLLEEIREPARSTAPA